MADILIDPAAKLNESLLDAIAPAKQPINTCGGCDALRTYACLSTSTQTKK